MKKLLFSITVSCLALSVFISCQREMTIHLSPDQHQGNEDGETGHVELFGSTAAEGYDTVSKESRFGAPRGVYLNSEGDIYICDWSNNRIQKWVPEANLGITVAGVNARGGSASDELHFPSGLHIDEADNIYIADCSNHRIQRWDKGSSYGRTVVGGMGQGSSMNQLSNPVGLYVDANGNVYIADTENHRIQKWSPVTSKVETVAGGNGGGAGSNQLNMPAAVCVDVAGNLFIADAYNHRIQKWAPNARNGETVAGGRGSGSQAYQFDTPLAIRVDSAGSLYISDTKNHRIQKWKKGANAGITIAGGLKAGGSNIGRAQNQFYDPIGLYIDSSGNLFVADYGNFRIQKWSPKK